MTFYGYDLYCLSLFTLYYALLFLLILLSFRFYSKIRHTSIKCLVRERKYFNSILLNAYGTIHRVDNGRHSTIVFHFPFFSFSFLHMSTFVFVIRLCVMLHPPMNICSISNTIEKELPPEMSSLESCYGR